jgi:phospholipid transport system substrate-binding protein
MLPWFVSLTCLTVASAPSPLEYTRRILEKTHTIVAGPGAHDEKLAELEHLLVDFLDTDAMGKASLGDHWSAFRPTQRQEFLRLFRTLFERTYVEKLLLFEQPKFGFDGEKVEDDRAQVDTRIITPNDEFSVKYKLRRAGQEWMATDIRIEDLSMTENFRNQMDRILAHSSPEVLLERMRKRYGKGRAGSGVGQAPAQPAKTGQPREESARSGPIKRPKESSS